MSGLTPIDASIFIKFLKYIGCEYIRQGKGSHVVWGKKGLNRRIIFPMGTLSKTVIKTNLQILNISTKEYLDILNKL